MNEVRSTKSIAVQAYEAVMAGRTEHDNPFPYGCDAHRHWRRVYLHVREELGNPAGRPESAGRAEGGRA